jgi:hypothetical protein
VVHLQFGSELPFVTLLATFFSCHSPLFNSVKMLRVDKEIGAQVAVTRHDRVLIQIRDTLASQEQIVNEIVTTYGSKY